MHIATDEQEYTLQARAREYLPLKVGRYYNLKFLEGLTSKRAQKPHQKPKTPKVL